MATANMERRTDNIPGMLFKNVQDFGQVDADWRAGFADQGLPSRWTLEKKNPPFLCMTSPLRDAGFSDRIDRSATLTLCC